MSSMNGSAPTVNGTRGVSPPEFYSRYVRRTFSRAMRGYSPAEVDAHLRMVEGCFSLAGFDRLLEERREELLGDALEEAEKTTERARLEREAAIEQAHREKTAVLQQVQREKAATMHQAHREAEETVQQARHEAEATAQQAHREAEATLARARHDAEIVLAQAARREEAAAEAERRFAGIRKLASEILDKELDAAA